MKILLYGHRGWIGQQVVSLLVQRGINYTLSECRVDDEVAVEKEIVAIEPTHLLCLIGRTHGGNFTTIDYLEQPGKLYENVRDNLFSPLYLAVLAERHQKHLTYMGTGCIFTYDEQHPFADDTTGFLETDRPNFFGSSYSIVKGFTDRLLKHYPVLNLRIRMPITADITSPRNFITKILNYEKICSVENSMSVLPDLLPVMLDMMVNQERGTFNFTNPGVISHNDILTLYRDILVPTYTWQNFTIEEQREILACERSNNCLNTDKLVRAYPIPDIKTSIRNLFLRMKLPNQEPCLLITGGCGFIGSNFINYYFPGNNRFSRIVNLDAMYYCARHENIHEEIRQDPHYIFIEGNLKDEALVKKILIDYGITHVIHFAAQSHVQRSFDNSLDFTYDNILGTHILIEACRKYVPGLVKFIHVSTDEVYGESMNTTEEMCKTEKSILCPTNPYAATKAGAELLVQAYSHSYKMPMIITRGNNVYGPNQYPEKVIPRFIEQLKRGEKVTIQGDGSAVRGFLHAEDTAAAFACILEKGQLGEIYNIGTEIEYSVMDIAKILIKEICGTENYTNWISYIPDRPFNDQRYYISNEKLKSLGWSIQIDFLTGLKELI